MIKIFLITFLSLTCLNGFSQKTHIPVKVFKIITYLPNGATSIKLDTVSEDIIITDLAYFAKHYNYPKQWLPDSLKNPIYKSQKVLVDVGKQAKKEYHYTKYTIYDSISRVITFGTSTCMVCEFSPIEYKVIYNSDGRIEKIAKGYWSSNFQNLFIITYFPGGNLNRFDVFNSGFLVKRIEAL